MSSPVASGPTGEGKVGDESQWSREEEKSFENALATVLYPSKYEATTAVAEDRWLEAVAARVPGKTLEQVKWHYELLVEDVNAIEAGRVPIPRYTVDDSSSSPRSSDGFTERRVGNGESEASGQGKAGSKSDMERRKGIPWTEEEHRLFLLGLDKYGKGDWRSISRNFVVSDPYPGCKPCTEVFHPSKFYEHRPTPIKHSRHHQYKCWRCTCFPRTHHRSGCWEFCSVCWIGHESPTVAEFACIGNIWTSNEASSSRPYAFCSWYSCHTSSRACPLYYASCISSSSIHNVFITCTAAQIYLASRRRNLVAEASIGEYWKVHISGYTCIVLNNIDLFAFYLVSCYPQSA